jgi:hypothetical protein
MGRIYGAANHVIAWLGLSGNHSDLAIDILERLDLVAQEEGLRRIHMQLEGEEVPIQVRSRRPVRFLLEEEELRVIVALATGVIGTELGSLRRYTFLRPSHCSVEQNRIAL